MTVTVESGPFGWLAGTHCLVVGVEDGPDGTLKVYVDARWKGLYAIVEDAEAQEAIRRAWANTSSHLTITKPPPECLFRDPVAPRERQADER
jgi:hypothetical protein